MAYAFLSYVREDAPIVDRLATTLRSYGIEVWLDRENIAAGSRWQYAIRAAIRSGDFFLACFSEHFSQRNRTYMNEELTLAIDELRQRPTDRAWFLPLLLSDTVIPDRDIGGGETLRSIQHVALYHDWSDGIRRILEVVPSSAAAMVNAQEMQKTVGKEALARVLRSLDTCNPDSAWELTRYGAAAVPFLVDALASASDNLFCNIVFELGEMASEAHAAVPLLCELLDQQQPPNTNDRRLRAIVHALGGIGDARAVGPLASALLWEKFKSGEHRCWYELLHSGCALQKLGEKAKSTLQALIDSDDPRARVRAAHVLYWAEYLSRSRYVNEAPDADVLSLVDIMTNELQSPDLCLEVLACLCPIGKHAAFKDTAILPLLDESCPSTCIAAIQTLSCLHSRNVAVTSKLRALMDSTNSKIQSAALRIKYTLPRE